MNEQSLSCNSPISWLGGKRLLREKLAKRLPEYTFWIEAMAGGAWLTLFLKPCKVEVLNDIDGELINFYNIVKHAPEELLLELQWDLVSRHLFHQYRLELNENRHVGIEKPLTNVERAKRFYYVLKTSFGSQRRTWGTGTTTRPKLNLQDVESTIMKAHNRLKRVVIENRDYRDIVDIYDRSHAFFYFDPPYRCKSARAYYAHFTDDDFRAFKTVLKGIKGRFIVSLNDDPFIRELFADFHIDTIETTYSIQKNKATKVQELLISNFDMSKKG